METLIDAALDWPTQKADFERDGSLRDIYVQDATAEDWKIVVRQILEGNYRARLHRDGAVVAMPADLDRVFDRSDPHFMDFMVGEVALACHFLTPTEIEFSFEPSGITETSLRGLMAFIVDLGDATRKPVIVTPENCRQSPIFSYDSKTHQLRWIPPHDSRH